MAKFNIYGDYVENELWGSNTDVDEDDVYEAGATCALEGGSEDDNPWPENSMAFETWMDGFYEADTDDDEDDLDYIDDDQ